MVRRTRQTRLAVERQKPSPVLRPKDFGFATSIVGGFVGTAVGGLPVGTIIGAMAGTGVGEVLQKKIKVKKRRASKKRWQVFG